MPAARMPEPDTPRVTGSIRSMHVEISWPSSSRICRRRRYGSASSVLAGPSDSRPPRNVAQAASRQCSARGAACEVVFGRANGPPTGTATWAFGAGLLRRLDRRAEGCH
jgi:hypothetical protein